MQPVPAQPQDRRDFVAPFSALHHPVSGSFWRSLVSVCYLVLAPAALSQVAANDDGSTGSAFATTDEDTVLNGASVTANDTDVFDVETTVVESANGTPVQIQDSSGTIGNFVYAVDQSGEAQALAAGESFEDTFVYSILGLPTPSSPFAQQLDATAGTDAFSWTGLPSPVAATGTSLPPLITMAHDFNGTSTRGTRASYNGNGDASDATWEFWLKPDVLENACIFETGGSGIGSGIYLDAAGTVRYQIKTGATARILTSSTALTAGQWHHVVATYDRDKTGANDELRIFIDGQPAGLEDSFTELDDWSGGDGAGLGGVGGDEGGDNANPGFLQNNGYSFFDGQIAVVRRYGRTLTPAEVLGNYNTYFSLTTDSATVTVEVTGANDAPEGTDDFLATGAVEDGPAFVSTKDLTANDGIHANYLDGPVGMPPVPVTDLLLHHDARDGAGVDSWTNRGSLGGVEGDWVFGSGVTLNPAVTSSRAQIAAAYEWDGTSDATAVLRNGQAEFLGGTNISTSSMSTEMWVKLDAVDLAQISTLFEAGGATGMGLVVDNGILKLGMSTQAVVVSYNLVTDPDGVLGAFTPTNEFFQVAASIDFANDLVQLFVNGQRVGSAVSTVNDWSGGDNAGMGRYRGSSHGGFENPVAAVSDYDTNFNGSVASFRLYGAALSEARIRQNYEAVSAGTDIDGDGIVVAGVIDNSGALVTNGTQATLPSGALVTIDDSTGAFTYDQNGVFDALSGGEFGSDTFLYQISDGNGGVGFASVTLSIEGRVDAVDDVLAATELISVNFPANFLVGNDQRAASTPGAYFSVDPASESGGAIGNQGTGGPIYDLNLTGGVVIAPTVLQSNFGGIGAALQNGAGSFASLQPIASNDATFEIWFQPQPLQTGKQILVDSGGSGNGLSIVYDADQTEIIFTVDGGDDNLNRIQAVASGVVPGEFNQLVAVYDRDSSGTDDTLAVYLNSDPTSFDSSVKGSDTNTNGTANIWAGTDGSGIGDITGTAALGESPSPFVGQIGITRIYPTKLSLVEIEANFDAVVQPIASLVGGSPLTTALGAVVTLNADGSVDYDASNLNVNIPDGDVVQDTFQYRISNGAGGTSTATVTVDVTGVGSFLAVDDSFAVGEDAGATTLDVRANDLDAGSATVLFQSEVGSYLNDFGVGVAVDDPADFRDGSGHGWQYLWNPPTDWDGTASVVGTGGALGTSANYVPLKWNGTYWSPDGDADTGNGAPGGFLNLGVSGSGHPGSGATNAAGIGNDEDRAVIAAYTVPVTGYYGIANSVVNPFSGTGVRVIVYVEDTETLNVPVAGGATSNFDGALGLVNQGDTVYIALSPDGNASSDSFAWDFDLVELPGPDSVPTVTFGSVSTNGTDIIYTPGDILQSLKDGESVTETISYTIDDGSGGLSTASLTVTVNGANDLPEGLADNGGITNENRPLSGGGVLANDTDADLGETSSLVVGAVQGSAGNVGSPVATTAGGSVTMLADGSFTYDPSGAFESFTLGDPDVVDTFTYTVQDANGADAAVATTVSITVVGLESNQQPIGSNTAQTVEYLAGSTAVGLFSPPSITDANGGPVTSSATSIFDTMGPRESLNLTAYNNEAEHAPGFSVAVVFTPTASDVAFGARIPVYENGGTSNGNGIYLLDGIPHFFAVMNGAQADAPSSRDDADWSVDKRICIPLAAGPIPADVPTEFGLVFSLDAVDFSINGGAAVTRLLTNRGSNWNWSGNDSLSFAELQSVGSRGALSDVAGDFNLNSYTSPEGTVSYGELWYTGLVTESGLTPESLTATLTVNPAEGSLTAPDGASYDGGSGVWTAVGSEDRINGLLAATTFVPNGTSPVDVALSISDGGEAGTSAVTGTLTFTAIVADEGTDTDSDGASDFLEFAFGTNPSVNTDNVDLALDGSVNGRPIVNLDFAGGLTFEAVFVRRDDHGTAGSVRYTVQFSSDLMTFEDSPVTPTVLADSTADSAYEVVSVPYPFFTSDGKKARFFRLKVDPVN